MAPRVLIASALLTLFAATVASAQNLVIHKEGSREYHRAWCPVIRDGKGVIALTRAQANARGLEAHADCDREPPGSAATVGEGGSPRKPAAIVVFVDGTKYYHRENCARLAGSAKRASLETAAKTHWPCPACRPPVRKKTEEPAVPKRGTRG